MSTVDSLAAELKRRYEGAAPRSQVVQIHLFAIEHADALRTVSIPALLEKAGMPGSYGTDFRKGVRLAPHVTVNR